MSTTVLSNASASDADLYNPSKNEQTENSEENKEKLKEKFKKVSVQIFELLSTAVDNGVLTAKDREEYMKGISMRNLEAGGATTLEIKNEWLEEHLKKYAPQFIEIARRSINKFLDDISIAQQNGWISAASAERWYQRLYERSSSTHETKTFLDNFNKNYMANWERLAEKLSELQDKKAKLQITSAQIPEIAAAEAKDFDELSYHEKAARVLAALAAIGVHENNQIKITQLYGIAKSKLNAATKAPRVMRDDQAAEWLESLFNRNRSATEIQKIISGTLTEYIGNWKKIRYRYDRLVRRMATEGVPPSISQHTEKSFLGLSWPEKENYVQEAEYAMNLLEKGFSDTPIDKMKLEIRSLIAQKDWEGAKAVIADAYKVAEGEDVYELKSMEDTIRLSQPTEPVEVENDSANETLQSMRQALAEVPPSVRGLYIQALSTGPQAFSSLCTYMYNRIWCWDNGYLNTTNEIQSARTAKQETKEVVERGHKVEGLENIDLDRVDETQKAEAMRPYDKTWAPTIIHLDASNGSSCGALVNELRGKVEARDYWTSLIIKNISCQKQRELVMSVNHRLKSGIRKLHAAGHGFKLAGKL